MTLIVNISAPRPEVNSKVHETLALTMDKDSVITNLISLKKISVKPSKELSKIEKLI